MKEVDELSYMRNFGYPEEWIKEGERREYWSNHDR
jgi:hypothetical protein